MLMMKAVALIVGVKKRITQYTAPLKGRSLMKFPNLKPKRRLYLFVIDIITQQVYYTIPIYIIGLKGVVTNETTKKKAR
jgi:hypothetical protein